MNKLQIGIFTLLITSLCLCIGAFFYVNDIATKILAVLIGIQTIDNIIKEIRRL